MKAIVQYEYGSPDVVEMQEIDKPAPGDDQVLVRVRAASVNPVDWHLMIGTPYLVRIAGGGLRKPKRTVLGSDVAGAVEAVGGSVTQFRPGDEVFGDIGGGAYAEYAAVREHRLARKPANLSFEEAAAVPVAALTALQGLRDKGQVEPGQKVLINGASGGVGTFAVQIAKALGADVTAVCSTRNVELVRSLGADRVIDYAQEDFTQEAGRYDVLFDGVGNRPLSDCKRVLTPGGTYVLVGGPKGRWLGPIPRLLGMLVRSRFGSQKMVSMLTTQTKEDMAVLTELIEAGKVTPVIDRRYTLSEAREALRYQGEGHAQGKSVITV